MKKQPDVSFIIPVYNMASTLPDTLESVSKVTGPFFEVVLINDGSTDHSGTVIDAFRKKMQNRRDVSINVFEVDKSGRGAARNLGVKKASGEYISFVDADDTIDSDEFERLWRCVTDDQRRSDIIAGQFLILGEDRRIYSRRSLPLSITCKELIRRIALLPFSPIHLNALVIKRSLFSRISEFDTKNINAEDKDVSIQLLREADGLRVCGSFHYLYHKHRVGRLLTAKKRIMWLWFRQITIYNNYSGFLRIFSMMLQAQYDLAKLFYELLFGYRGRRG